MARSDVDGCLAHYAIAGQTDSVLPIKKSTGWVWVVISNINATLVNNLAILADIQRKIDILSEILTDQGDHTAIDNLNTEVHPHE